MRDFKPTVIEQSSPELYDLPTHIPVAVYYRQSSDAQIGNISTSMQQIDLVEDMKRRGWNEDEILLIDMDEGVSGTLKIDEREGMKRLFGLISEGKIGAVACQDEDRLFRDVTQIQVNIFIEACRAAQVQIITPSITYVFHHPTMGDFYRKQFRFKSEMAAEYLNFLKMRLGKARERLMLEGKWAGQRLSTGYMADMRDEKSPTYRQIVPFPSFAPVILEIFRTFVETKGSAYHTHRLLKAHGITVPTLEDRPVPDGFRVNYEKRRRVAVPRVKTIKEIVTNPMYVGHFMYKGAVLIWNNHEPIVPDDLFYTAFNLASKHALDGSENVHFKGKRPIARPKDIERPADIERPLLEGKLWVCIEGQLRQTGVRYSAKSATYDYTWDQQGQVPGTLSWRRNAAYIDSAVTHFLRQRLLSTAGIETVGETIKRQIEAREADLRRLNGQIAALERAMQGEVDKIVALSDLSLIGDLEKRYGEMKKEHARLITQRQRIEASGTPLKQHRAVVSKINEWLQEDDLPAEALIQLTGALVERVEIPEFEPRGALKVAIYWTDSKATKFELQHKANDRVRWDFAEIEALKHFVSAGASQLVLSAALPKRGWGNIRRAINRRYGIIDTPHSGMLWKSETFARYMWRAHGVQVTDIEIIEWKSGEKTIQARDIETGETVFISETGEKADITILDNSTRRLRRECALSHSHHSG